MAHSIHSVWEVHTGGADTNGGGFVAGGAGTDYSLVDAKRTATGANDSTTDAVAVGTGVITSVTAAFTSALVDNIIYLQGGSGSLAAGWYRVITYTSSTSITVDRNVATGTGITMNIGGAMASINVLNTVAIAGNKIFVKAGTYTRTATTTMTGSTYYWATVSRPLRIIGYNATRGDNPTGNNRPLISLSTNTGLVGIDFTDTGGWIENIRVNCNGLGTSTGLQVTTHGNVINCSVSEFTVYGINGTAGSLWFDRCEAFSGTSAATAAIRMGGSGRTTYCWAHDNACLGFSVPFSTASSFERSIASDNTGASSDGFRFEHSTSVTNCIAHGNGRDGIRSISGYVIGQTVMNNILTSNAGYGLNWLSASLLPALPCIQFNAFKSNTSGETLGFTTTTGSDGVGALTPTNITLTVDPFTDAANDDYTLNTTAGGGAACRAAGFPGTLTPGAMSKIGYLDIGVFQHQDSSGGSGPVGRSTIIARGSPY